MALSTSTEFRLDHAVTDDQIGDEIAARVEVSSTPGDEAAAQAILDLLDSSKNASIAERLFTALAGDGNGASGKELAKKINGMVAVLEAKAAGVGGVKEVSEITADSRTNTSDGQFFDISAQDGSLYRVYIDTTGGDSTQPAAGGRILTRVDISGAADTAAGSGDAVAAILDAIDDFDCPATGTGVILCTDAATGTAVDVANGDLANAWAFATTQQGVDAPSISEAQTAMGSESMSETDRFNLEHALASKPAADEFKVSYDTMVAAIQAIS